MRPKLALRGSELSSSISPSISLPFASDLSLAPPIQVMFPRQVSIMEESPFARSWLCYFLFEAWWIQLRLFHVKLPRIHLVRWLLFRFSFSIVLELNWILDVEPWRSCTWFPTCMVRLWLGHQIGWLCRFQRCAVGGRSDRSVTPLLKVTSFFLHFCYLHQLGRTSNLFPLMLFYLCVYTVWNWVTR